MLKIRELREEVLVQFFETSSSSPSCHGAYFYNRGALQIATIVIVSWLAGPQEGDVSLELADVAVDSISRT